jgi:simple sugar transport system permease protein
MKRIAWPLIALALLFLIDLFAVPGFFSISMREGALYGSLIDILKRGAPVMLVACGMSLVIATGGIDLSVGAIMALAGAVAAQMLQAQNANYVAIIGVCLGVAAVLGGVNGMLVGFFKIQPIVATLILMVAGRGAAQLVTDGQMLRFSGSEFTMFGGAATFGLPNGIYVAAIAFLLVFLLTRTTALGLFIEATGGSEKAAHAAGVQTRWIKVAAYVICAICAALAGLVFTSDTRVADANSTGLYYELDAILCVVVGGQHLAGGRFNLVGAFVGAVLIQAMTTTILTTGVPSDFTLVVKAVVVLAVCVLQSDEFRRRVGLNKGGAT